MYVSHLTLKNWRNFRDVNVALGRRIFLIGPNASGKSNLLDVFRFLRDIAKAGGGGLQQAISDHGGFSSIRCLAARRYPDIEISVEFRDEQGKEDIEPPQWSYSLGIKQRPRGDRRPYVAYEKVVHNANHVLIRPNAEDKSDEPRLTQTYLEQINANADFREIAKYFESICYLHLVPQLTRHPREFSGPGLTGDPFGRSFLERIGKTPERTRNARLKLIEQALRVAVPQLKQLSYIVDAEEGGIPHLEAVYEHWRPHAGRQRERDFSDGTLRLIGLFWCLLENDSLLLLEEPELSLNTAIVSKLPALFARAQRRRNRQIIVSTHSHELLSDEGIDPKEVLLLIPGKEGTEVRNANDLTEVRQLVEGGFNIAEAVLPRTVPHNSQQLALFE